MKEKSQRAKRREAKIHPEIGGIRVSGRNIPERRKEIKKKRTLSRENGYIGQIDSSYSESSLVTYNINQNASRGADPEIIIRYTSSYNSGRFQVDLVEACLKGKGDITLQQALEQTPQREPIEILSLDTMRDRETQEDTIFARAQNQDTYIELANYRVGAA